MELTQLYYFITVAKYEHVTKAANELKIAQPALTKAIHNLEKELNIKLFSQSGRNIKLTNWGLWLRDKVNDSLFNLLAIPNEIAKMKNTNNIRLSVNAATMFVTDAIIEYQKKNKDIKFSITQHDDTADIIIDTSLKSEGKDSFLEKIFLATSKEENIIFNDIIDLKDKPFICFTEAKEFRAICDSLLKNYFTPKIGFECDNVTALHRLIASNIGVGLWPEFSWKELSSDIKMISLDNYDFKRYINVYQTNSSIFNIDTVNDFYNYLISCFKAKKTIKHS